MRVQMYAFEKFRKVYDAKIPVYVVYGSHDFSPVAKSVIDLLHMVGYITKVTKEKPNNDGKISLGFQIDEKTGVKIAGLSGLKVGKDREWYEKLDRDSLQAETGFKIFMFHGGISDMKTDSRMDGDLMPLSLLPKGFSYYAGGHMHKWNTQECPDSPDYPYVVHPGTIFAGYHSDLEENARGQKRGFALVEFEEDVKSVKFIELENTQYELIEVDAKNKKAESVNQELEEKTKEINPKDKVVIIKIAGELTSGKTADVDISSIKEKLAESGSRVVNISRNKLTSKEYSITEVKGSNREEIETNMFEENIGQFRFDQKELLDKQGIELAKELLRELGQEKTVNESISIYNLKIQENALKILGLDKDDS